MRQPPGDGVEVERRIELAPVGGLLQDRLPHLVGQVDDGAGGAHDLLGRLELHGVDEEPHERVVPARPDEEDQALDELVLETALPPHVGLGLLDQGPGPAHHHRQDEALPVGEVAVDGRPGDAGHPGDVLHRRLPHAVALEAGLGGGEEVLLRRLAVVGDYSVAAGHPFSSAWAARNRANSSGIGSGRSVVRMTTFSAS